MKIALDLDGVIYPWHHAAYNELAIYYNLDVDEETFWTKTWRTYKNDLFWENLISIKHLYTNQIANPDDVSFVKELAKENQIYYITNRPLCVKEETISWLTKNGFPNVENLIITKDKVLIANSLGIDIFVEDRVEALEKLSHVCKVFGIRQLHNLEKIDGYKNANSLHELKGEIYELNRVS